ncbi:MAG: CoA transferase [Rhodovulum sp.]|jgi:alpha-methylacyl-CoA racemase|nr:CoA transferase [Rhodovulum sp.]
MTGALDDLKVLDFSTLLPGPMASLFLADAGAQVIKVERPVTGEDMRAYVPKWGSDSVNFLMLNRGKQSLALNLKDPDARTVLDPLLREADVVIEQFRPGVMARLGLGYDEVRAINPDVIYCSISGYGQTGPKALRAGHDLNYIGDAGMLALSHGDPERAVLPPALIADIAGGTYPALLNILLALRARDAGKGGAHLDISMAENLFPFLYWAMGEGQAANAWPGNGDALVTGGSPRYQLYATADNRVLAAAPIEDKFWAMFCDAIGLDERLRNDTADPAATRDAIAAIIKTQPSAHWHQVFEVADCCCSIVRTVQEAMQDPHFRARGVFDRQLSNAEGDTITALPTPIARVMAADPSGTDRAPRLGQDNDDLTSGA